MYGSWRKIYESLPEWEWYKKSEMVHLFIHLVLKANVKPGFFEGVEVKRGEFITSRRKLSEQTGISEQSVRTCLKRMERSGEILLKSANHFTLISICNYSKFQDKPEESNQRVTSKQPAGNHNIRMVEGKNNIYSQKFTSTKQYSEDFETLWQLYKEKQHPKSREGSKYKAYLKYNELISNYSFDTIKKHIEHYVSDCNKKDHFTSHFVTFLNQNDFGEDIEKDRQANIIRYRFGDEIVEVPK